MSAARRPVGDDDGAVARNARSDDRSDALGQHWPCGARAYHLAPLGAHDDGVREGAVRCAPAVGAVGLTSGGCTTCAAHTRYDTPGLRPCALTAGAHTDHGLTVLGRSVASTVQAIRRHLPQQRARPRGQRLRSAELGPQSMGSLRTHELCHTWARSTFFPDSNPQQLLSMELCVPRGPLPPPPEKTSTWHTAPSIRAWPGPAAPSAWASWVVPGRDYYSRNTP